MSAYRDGAPFPVTIFEAAALHYAVNVICARCRNSAVFEPGGLWWRFYKKRWNDHFSDARVRFWCTCCARGGIPRSRAHRLEAVRATPERYLPPPDEREWKRAVSRFRT